MRSLLQILALVGWLSCGAAAEEAGANAPEPTGDEIAAQLAVAPRSLLPEDGNGFRLFRVAFRVGGGGDRVQEIVGVHFPAAGRLLPADPDLPVIAVPSASARILSSRPVALPELLEREPRALLPDADRLCDYVLKDVPEVRAARLPKAGGGFAAVGFYHRGVGRLIFPDKARQPLVVPADVIVEEKPRAAAKETGPSVKLPTTEELAEAKERQRVTIARLMDGYKAAEDAHTKLAARWEAYREAYTRAERLQLWVRDAKMANLFSEAQVEGHVRIRMPDGTDRIIPIQDRNEEARKELARQDVELDALVAQMREVRKDIARLQAEKRKAVKQLPTLMSSLARAQATIRLVAPDDVAPFPAPPIEVLPPRTFLAVVDGKQQRMAQFTPGGQLQPWTDAEAARSTTARAYETGDVNSPPPGTVTSSSAAK